MSHTTTNPTCPFAWALDLACIGQVNTASEALALMRMSGYDLSTSMLAVRACVRAGLIA